MCNETTIDYDGDGYEKSLEKLVTMSEKEYYVHLVDINRHQVIVAKTLLWLTVVIIGFNVTFMEWSYTKSLSLPDLIPVLTPSYFFIIISIISCVIGFACSAMAIPAFGGYKPLYDESWAEHSGEAYKNMDEGNDSVYSNTLNKLLTTLDQACALGNETNGARGVKLRISSILTIVSAASTVIGFIVFSFKYYL
jgi:hypothetical protein